MLDDHSYEIYEENPFPIAYLLTFRTYGTWLHGDGRGSYRRHRNEHSGTKWIEPNVPLNEKMMEKTAQPPVELSPDQRSTIREAIVEVCEHRAYLLRALNVRTNHVHAVVSKAIKPEKIVNDFKVYSTRKLRNERNFSTDLKLWSRGASTRYLWNPKHVLAAVDYVLYCQEDIPFEFE